jgi:hypothetical protein
MTGAEDMFNLVGRLGDLGDGKAAQLLAGGLPELLKVVAGAVSGLGGLGQALGPDVAKTLGEVSGSVRDIWDLGGGADLLAQVTKSVGALQQFNPLRG